MSEHPIVLPGTIFKSPPHFNLRRARKPRKLGIRNRAHSTHFPGSNERVGLDGSGLELDGQFLEWVLKLDRFGTRKEV